MLLVSIQVSVSRTGVSGQRMHVEQLYIFSLLELVFLYYYQHLCIHVRRVTGFTP